MLLTVSYGRNHKCGSALNLISWNYARQPYKKACKSMQFLVWCSPKQFFKGLIYFWKWDLLFTKPFSHCWFPGVPELEKQKSFEWLCYLHMSHVLFRGGLGMVDTWRLKWIATGLNLEVIKLMWFYYKTKCHDEPSQECWINNYIRKCLLSMSAIFPHHLDVPLSLSLSEI